MKPVQVISASAGSGKTSRLARHLAAEIREGRVRPEGVVAVTFTVKAAAELARRVREELLRHGKVDEARRLGAARIGTVHSVCGRLLSDFAFDLGLSPDLTVLDQESAAAALKRSLSSVVTREDEESLSELQSLFADLDLEEAARKIQDAARSNGIDAATLHARIANHIRYPYTSSSSSTDTWVILNLADHHPYASLLADAITTLRSLTPTLDTS